MTEDGIIVTRDYSGKALGDVYVRFTSREGSEQVLKKNKEKIGHRFGYYYPLFF